jgi:hypothetical protein
MYITVVIDSIYLVILSLILTKTLNKIDQLRYIHYEIINKRWVLIFVNFVVHLNHENKNPTKYNLPIDFYL